MWICLSFAGYSSFLKFLSSTRLAGELTIARKIEEKNVGTLSAKKTTWKGPGCHGAGLCSEEGGNQCGWSIWQVMVKREDEPAEVGAKPALSGTVEPSGLLSQRTEVSTQIKPILSLLLLGMKES